MTQAEMNSVLGGRSAYDSLLAILSKFKTGESLGPEQRQQMLAIAQRVQQKLAAKESSLGIARSRLATSQDIQDHKQIYNQLQEELTGIDEHPYSIRNNKGQLRFFDTPEALAEYRKAMGL
jgi:hypothetical protein